MARREILPVLALLLVGACAFVNLMAIPAFEDEGTQLRGAWRLAQLGEWLPPLNEGKPLEAWVMAPFIGLGSQPLATIRGLHVLAGMIGAVLTYWLALRLTDRRTALVCGFLFALCPFVVYLQRLALSDILLCTSGLWVSLSILRLIEAPTGVRSCEVAAATVLAAFCKFPVGFIFIGYLPLALILLPGGERARLLGRPALGKVLAAVAPAGGLALVVAVAAAVRWSHGHPPGFGLQDLLGIGAGQYSDIAAAIGIARPQLLTELDAQLSWPVVALAGLGLAVSAAGGDWRQRWLLATGLLPLLAIGLLARFWYSRYLLFTLPPLIVCAACGWRSLSLQAGWIGRSLALTALTLCLLLMGYQSALLIRSPLTASWSALDRFQYFEGWGSGYGYPAAAQFILHSSATPRWIYSLDGHSAYQLRTYLPAAWGSRIEPVGYGPDGAILSDAAARLANVLERAPVWIIVADPLLPEYLQLEFGSAAARLQVRRIAEFPKPGTRARLAIYAIGRAASPAA